MRSSAFERLRLPPRLAVARRVPLLLVATVAAGALPTMGVDRPREPEARRTGVGARAETDLLATYNFTRHLQGYAGYSFFSTGGFIKKTGRDSNSKRLGVKEYAGPVWTASGGREILIQVLPTALRALLS